MKRWMLCLLTMMVSALIQANTQKVDGIVWNYTVDVYRIYLKINGVETTISGEISIPRLLHAGSPVTTIGYGAFKDCNKITSVKIPEYMRGIDPTAFDGCYSLESFIVDESNETYISIDGLLCNKKTSSIVRCPGASVSVTIPANIVSIEARAFATCYGLKEVIIPEGVVSIGESAFDSCLGLKRVELPASIATIGSSVFDLCNNLESIVFRGGPPENVAENCFPNVIGYYFSDSADEWESVIDESGKWNGLSMELFRVDKFESIPGEMESWLTYVLAKSGGPSKCTVRLMDGMDIKELKKAQLLGVVPEVLINNDIATVIAESAFKVNTILVNETSVEVLTRINAGIGKISSPAVLGGGVRLFACKSLKDAWVEIPLDVEQVQLVRRSDVIAELAIKDLTHEYKFFKVIIE